jgi:hypothetical protein
LWRSIYTDWGLNNLAGDSKIHDQEKRTEGLMARMSFKLR